MGLKTYQIEITGIVQGVGFRPFLYNLARSFNLKGKILNRGNAGVRLLLVAKQANIHKFIEKVKEEKPDISFIEDIKIKEIEINESFSEISIEKSEDGRGISLTLPPDIAMCENCITNMRDPSLPKYYKYPFVACAVCGPRYTTVKELPYDRERTTMYIFPFCKKANPESCIQEYSDFENRRFHAQTFACAVCGPRYSLYDPHNNKITNENIDMILKKSAEIVNRGEILAVKGIGGVHLVCLAEDYKIISKIRVKKGERKNKPFAVMIPNLPLIEDYFLISNIERNLLTSFRRPIVLLEKSTQKNNLISENVAPGLNNVGFMLPYSGIHHLLFDYIGQKPLVYTSGNKSSIPMAVKNEEIIKQLNGLADYFLLHNRPIYQRVDDSVVRVHDTKHKLIRRSRGYVPEYIPLPFEVETPAAIATGPLLNTTGAILRRDRIFPTQHIGNVTHLETYNFLENALFHVKTLLKIPDKEIKYIACDNHPRYMTTEYAKQLSRKFEIPLFQIPHHYAHSLALMAENNIAEHEKIIAITTDGVGYGIDENLWGGEVLVCSYQDFQRVGSNQYQPMIGGDRCVRYPARMLASILLNSSEIEEAYTFFEKKNLFSDLEYGKDELNTIIQIFKNSKGMFKEKQIPLSSSTGRIFDSISYLLGACKIKTYRGEPAMKLEGLAMRGSPDKVPLQIEAKDIINTSKLIMDIIELLENQSYKPEDIAYKFHSEYAKTFAKMAIKNANSHNISKIGLTGGVAYNYLFSKTIKKVIIENDFDFLEHHKIPPGDAGISIGQIIGGFFKYSDLNVN